MNSIQPFQGGQGESVSCTGCFVLCNAVTVKRCGAFRAPHAHQRCPKCRHDQCKFEMQSNPSRGAVMT